MNNDSMDLAKDLYAFIRERRKFWLAPLVFIMLLLSTLFFALEGSIIAPLIYTIF